MCKRISKNYKINQIQGYSLINLINWFFHKKPFSSGYVGEDRFIDELPLGIDTIVGERGSRLSGGQKQRIAIARALTREPKLMVLDEATNGLDEEPEREILNTLMDLKGEVTMLFLTHRKLVLEIADQVVELKNGKIIKP